MKVLRAIDRTARRAVCVPLVGLCWGLAALAMFVFYVAAEVADYEWEEATSDDDDFNDPAFS